MKLAIVGHGYVGLVTACVFAHLGNDVWVIGHTAEKLKRLQSGDPIIFEPGLEELLQKNLEAQRLHFTSDFKEALAGAEVVFIGVGTPPKQNGEADLAAVLGVAEQIGKHLTNPYTVISCKSTVPVGTNLKVAEIITRFKKPEIQFDVASCPEFLREGTALGDTLHPDRIVIGSNSKTAIDTLLKLHKPIDGERIITNLASAELIKYASNAMLATKISFANMIANLAEASNANVDEVLHAVGMDKRIGRLFLYPGVGYGGSCLPKDVKALIHTGESFGGDMALLKEVDQINVSARKKILKKVKEMDDAKHIAIWGLAFKPDTDDIRESPPLHIIHELLEDGYHITVYDPEAMENVKKQMGSKITYAKTSYDAVKDADLLLILTEWNEFKQLDLTAVHKLMRHPAIIEGRNIYDPATVREKGFSYVSVGRP